jgi:hypothetical protein
MHLLLTLLLYLCLSNSGFTQSQSAINGTYQVEGIECIIDFKDGEAKFHFNPNLCITSYSILDSSQIRFQNSMMCTEVCCDDELDKALKIQINRINSYKLKGQKLHLYGSDTLILIKKD